MAVIRKSQKSNFRPRPQRRRQGTGMGRSLFPWKRLYPWLVMAAEQFFVVSSGSADAMLEDRQWVMNWNLTPASLAKRMEQLFPGISKHLAKVWDWKTPWPELLKNRVYKMYYSGTSDRGPNHDPHTRATVSREHWRYWEVRKLYEKPILRIVSRRLVCKCWKSWSHL